MNTAVETSIAPNIIAQLRASAPVRRELYCDADCKGTMITHEDGTGSRCACYWRERRRVRWVSAGGPARLWQTSNDDIANEKLGHLHDLFLLALESEGTDGPMPTVDRTGQKSPLRSVLLIGGSRADKDNFAASVMQDVLVHTPQAAMGCGLTAARWYDFAALRAILSDYTQQDAQRGIFDQMRETYLVVITNITSAGLSPAFITAWDIMMTARHNAALHTIFTCECDAIKINSLAWQDVLAEKHTLPVGLGQASAPAPNTVSPAPPRAAAGRATRTVLETREQVEEEIIMQVAKLGTPIWTKLRDAVGAADDTMFTAALRALVKTGDIVEEKRAGKTGTLTVYTLTAENAVARPAATKKRTLAELEALTGGTRSTLARWRTKGMSDEEIIARCNEN